MLLGEQLVHFFDRWKGVWQAVILVVPASDSPEVVRWWNDMEDNQAQVKFKYCPHKDRPHLHVFVFGSRTIRHEGGEAHGLHGLVPLPRSMELGLTESRWVHSNIPRAGGRLTGTHPERALRITVVLPPPGRLPRLLFRAFWPLLMPLLFWDRASFVAKVAVACPFCFLLGLLMWIGMMTAKQHFDVHLRRFQRLARLSKLRRAAERVAEVFSHEDCCICLADLGRGDGDLTMLLPCMHVVHHSCYSSWVGAPSYVAVHLRCPLCNCRTAGVAHPVAVDTPALRGEEGDAATAAPRSVEGASAADAAGASDGAQRPEL